MGVVFGEMVKEGAKYFFGVTAGVGITLSSLMAWTGTSDLNLIKEGVTNYINASENSVSYLAENYWSTVDSANAEIADYKDALAEANGNITKLVEAYNNAETQHQQELEAKQTELEELQTQLAENYISVDEANEIIAKANEQIGAANDEVKAASTEVYGSLINSQMNINSTQALNNAKGDSQNLQVGGDKSVQDISSIVPQE